MAYIIFLTLLLAPTYALRFSLFGLPLNLLMVWIVVLWLIFGFYMLSKNRLADFWLQIKNLNKPWLWLISLFFLAGTLSFLIQGVSEKKLGQYLVLFIQPISLLFIFGYYFKKNPGSKNSLLYAAYLLLGLMGVWSIIQYFTLFSLPQQYWGNAVEPKRSLGFFVHPNFYALFVAPLLVFLLPDLVARIRNYKNLPLTPKLFIFWLLGTIGLFLSMSRAGWVGAAAAVLIYVFVAGDKKIRITALIFGLLLAGTVLVTPNLRYRMLLPFMGEKSTVSRFSLWHTGIKAVQESPLLGLGLGGFGSNWNRLNTDPNLDTHNLPHNIFLDFWVETGLLGLLSFIGLVALGLYKGLKDRANALSLGVALFLIALLVQGQIDNPYFKNDLALIFWIILSLGI